MTVNNLPQYAKEYKYIVATNVDGELWFYGAYNDYMKAESVVEMLGEGEILRQ